MPSAPELAGVWGEIWQPEVLHQLEAEDFCKAAGDVRVTCEIAENLQGECDCCEQDCGA